MRSVRREARPKSSLRGLRGKSCSGPTLPKPAISKCSNRSTGPVHFANHLTTKPVHFANHLAKIRSVVRPNSSDWFCNLFRRPVVFEQTTFATAEHAYQAGKPPANHLSPVTRMNIDIQQFYDFEKSRGIAAQYLVGGAIEAANQL